MQRDFYLACLQVDSGPTAEPPTNFSTTTTPSDRLNEHKQYPEDRFQKVTVCKVKNEPNMAQKGTQTSITHVQIWEYEEMLVDRRSSTNRNSDSSLRFCGACNHATVCWLPPEAWTGNGEQAVLNSIHFHKCFVNTEPYFNPI